MNMRTAASCVLCFCILTLSAIAVAAPALLSKSVSTTADDQLSKIIDNPLTWKLLDGRSRKPVEPIIGKHLGEDVLAENENNGLVLQGLTDYQHDIEITARLGFKPDEKKFSLAQFVFGLPAGDDFTAKTPYASMDTYGGPTRVRSALYDGVERKPTGQFYYDLSGIPVKSFGWPDEIRRIVETNNAKLKVNTERWFTFRAVVREREIDMWFDGRYAGKASTEDGSYRGFLRVYFREGTKLASLNVRSLANEDRTFLPVVLDQYLNASQIDGQPIDRSQLPASGELVNINGVPFRFASPDEEGNDHIDLEQSQFLQGNMEMNYASNRGVMGGRWVGARRPVAHRIALSVKNARYNKIHFIAAADEDKDQVPTLSAILYVPLTGVEKVYKAEVQPFRKDGEGALSVATDTGLFAKKANLYHVTLDIDPGDLAGFDDREQIEIELCKDVRMYRTYPDPISYSQHQAGPPSSVHVYAMTMQEPAVKLAITPGVFGEYWTAPAKPTYSFDLTNITDQPREVSYSFVTVAHNGERKVHDEKTVTVQPGKPTKVNLLLELSRFGYHDIYLTLKDGDETWTEHRSLANLHPDTRERGNWEDGRGALFGIWSHFGGHDTPHNDVTLPVINAAGIETMGGSFSSKRATELQREFAKKNGMLTTLVFHAADMYVFNEIMADLKKGVPEAEAVKKGIDKLKENESVASEIVRKDIVRFFPEPHISRLVGGVFPDYWGDDPIEYTDYEKDRLAQYAKTFSLSAEAIREGWPDAKLLLPHGDVIFAAELMRHHPEINQYVDGVAVDMPNFERLPEMQLHQVCNNRLWLMHEEFKKHNKTPFLELREGPAVPTYPGSVSEDTQADYYPRIFMQMMAYGCQRISCPGEAWDANSYYAAQHYGCGGIHRRKPFLTPKPSYTSYAALTRNINRCNFEKWIETGSLSSYCLQFKHYKNNKLVHAMWTIRGKRNVTLEVADGTTVTVYDNQDNPTKYTADNGLVTFPITSSPCYVHGLTGDPKIALGKPDHSDSKPGERVKKIASLGDGSWKMVDDREPDYENNSPFHHKRFHGPMTAKTTKAKTLAITLGDDQDASRKTMPYYSIIEPRRPIEIAGKASHIGLEVTANSDWGRVVYFLRDAKGERWISIGDAENWNCDDIHQWSVFCFDGKRYLRFEMPSHAGYDNYREKGTTWWGSLGGDSVVDLPLSLERIAVERRTHAIHVNELVETNTADIELGDLFVEYASDFDMSNDVVKRSRLRMQPKGDVPNIDNPIVDMAKTGELSATKVTKIGTPDHHADGTQCHVFFDTVDTAATYDVWISAYADGRGAIKLGPNWKEPGGLVRGLRPGVTFYAFVTYKDADGKQSKPSAGYEFVLKDLFYQK